MLVVVSLLMESCAIESLSIRAIGNERLPGVFPFSKRWKRISNETMDFFIHVSLSYIGLLVVLMMMSSLTEPVPITLGAVWNE